MPELPLATPAASAGIATAALAGLSPAQALLGAISAGRFMLSKWQEHRVEQLRPILIEELSAGRTTLLDAYKIDPFLSCVHRWDRAAVEGAARYKLRLMARVLAGQMEGPALIADEFLSFAALIESLRREEIIFAATQHRLEVLHGQTPERAAGHPEIEQERLRLLVPKVFASEVEMMATGTALMRTGLMIAPYRCGPLMAKFAELTRLDAFDDTAFGSSA